MSSGLSTGDMRQCRTRRRGGAEVRRGGALRGTAPWIGITLHLVPKFRSGHRRHSARPRRSHSRGAGISSRTGRILAGLRQRGRPSADLGRCHRYRSTHPEWPRPRGASIAGGPGWRLTSLRRYRRAGKDLELSYRRATDIVTRRKCRISSLTKLDEALHCCIDGSP